MDARTREQARAAAGRNRKSPRKPQRVHFPVEGNGECAEILPDLPLELHIEATDEQGRVVGWLTDEWWIRTHAVCKDRDVTVMILPTPGVLLDDFIVHQLEMVRRIAPRWRIIGCAPSGDVIRQPAVERWLRVPCDEIRFCEFGEDHQERPSEAAREVVNQAAAIPPARGFRRARMSLGTPPADFIRRPALQELAAALPTRLPQCDRTATENVVQSP